MRKSNLDSLWASLPKKVKLIFVMKDGRIIPAEGYEPVRCIGGGYPYGEPRYCIHAYRKGWGSTPVDVKKFDVMEIQNRKRDFEYWLEENNQGRIA